MVKTVVYLEDDVWKAFKERVFAKHGTLRKTSKDTNRILRDYLMQDLKVQLSSLLPSAPLRLSGPSGVAKNRPKVKGSSASIIRAMRDSRKR